MTNSQQPSFQAAHQSCQKLQQKLTSMMVKWLMTGIKTTDQPITQGLTHMTTGPPQHSSNLMLEMMVKLLFRKPESKLLRCKLKWTMLLPKLIKRELLNKLNMIQTFKTMTQLLNCKVLWMLNKVFTDSPLPSVTSQTWTKLTVWPKNLESQWLQNLCNSVPTRLSQMLWLRSLSAWENLKPRSKRHLTELRSDLN